MLYVALLNGILAAHLQNIEVYTYKPTYIVYYIFSTYKVYT